MQHKHIGGVYVHPEVGSSSIPIEWYPLPGLGIQFQKRMPLHPVTVAHTMEHVHSAISKQE